MLAIMIAIISLVKSGFELYTPKPIKTPISNGEATILIHPKASNNKLKKSILLSCRYGQDLFQPCFFCDVILSQFKVLIIEKKVLPIVDIKNVTPVKNPQNIYKSQSQDCPGE